MSFLIIYILLGKQSRNRARNPAFYRIFVRMSRIVGIIFLIKKIEGVFRLSNEKRKGSVLFSVHVDTSPMNYTHA